MRSFLISLLVVLVLVIGYLGYVHFSGGALPTLGLPLGGEKARVRAVTKAFFEHVKFKDQKGLIAYVAPGTNPAEADAYLDKTLGRETEKFDLVSVEIKSIEIDSKQTRARVHVMFYGQDLVAHKPVDLEKIVFLFRTDDGNWLVDIRSLSP